jgi:ribosome-binding protein aMBF1 (putative translation factor)
MLEMYSFGSWLRLKREAIAMTDEGLADRVDCTIATLHKLEDEESCLAAQIIERLAEILNTLPLEKSDV